MCLPVYNIYNIYVYLPYGTLLNLCCLNTIIDACRHYRHLLFGSTWCTCSACRCFLCSQFRGTNDTYQGTKPFVNFAQLCRSFLPSNHLGQGSSPNDTKNYLIARNSLSNLESKMMLHIACHPLKSSIFPSYFPSTSSLLQIKVGRRSRTRHRLKKTHYIVAHRPYSRRASHSSISPRPKNSSIKPRKEVRKVGVSSRGRSNF